MYRRVVFFTLLIIFSFFISTQKVLGTSLDFKIPFQYGEEWKVTQGYEGDGWSGSNPTHNKKNKDRYAIDFSLPGELDYDKIVFAAESGIVYVKEQVVVDKVTGKKNYAGYGKYIDIDHGDGIISRYAHLLSYSVEDGVKVEQGQEIGRVDNTGYKGGSHLHFAVYKKNEDGVLEPYKPEPISGYTNIKAGNSYVSDNELYDPNKVKQEKPAEKTETQVENNKSFWDKIKETFTKVVSFFNFDKVDTQENTQVDSTEQKTVEDNATEKKVESKIFNLQFVDKVQTFEVTPKTELKLSIEIKNFGSDLSPGDISLNVVGGLETNKIFKHPSWITSLRPAVLSKNIKTEESGSLDVVINAPEQTGNYVFKLQIVRQSGGSFTQVGSDFFTANITVKEEVKNIEPQTLSTSEPIVNPEKVEEKEVENNLGDTIKNISDVVKKTVEQIWTFFGGGGSSGSSGGSSQNDSKTEENKLTSTVNELGNLTNTSTITIAGTRSEDVTKIFINNLSEGVEYISSTAWKKEISLFEGENNFEIYGTNESEEKTVTNSFKITLDSIPPSTPILDVIVSNVDKAEFSLSWSGEDGGSGISYYELERNEGIGFTSLVTSTNTDYIFTGEKQKTYQFRVRGVDKAGNYSAWSGENNGVSADWPMSVVINEINWAGTSKIKNSAGDCTQEEWLELYNNTDTDVDLSGWSIFIGDNIIPLSGTIKSQDYFLISRENNFVLLEPVSDLVSVFDLPDSGAKIILKNGENTIDEVNTSSGWFNAPNEKNFSLMRIDSSVSGSLSTNWKSGVFEPVKGKSRCGTIYGSPRRKNTGDWLIDNLDKYAHLLENNILTLKKEDGPYFFTDAVNIAVGKKLVVEAGTILAGAFRSGVLKVGGELELNGTESEPIIITSALDNNYISNNPTALVGSAAPGDWSRVEILDDGKFTAHNTKFLYGGGETYVFLGNSFVAQVIRNMGGEVQVEDSEFKNNNFNSTSRDKDTHIVVYSENTNNNGAKTILNNNVFDGGYIAIKNTSGVNSEISGNIFSNFANEKMINTDLSTTKLQNNNVGDSLVDLGSFTLIENTELGQGNYLFSTVIIPVEKTLSILGSGKIKFSAGGSITVNGNLFVDGGEEKIIFEPYQSGQYWNAVIFNNSNSIIKNATFSKGNFGGDGTGMIKVNNSTVDFENVIFSDANRTSPYNMVYLNNSTTTMKDSSVIWHTPKVGSKTMKGMNLHGGNLNLDNVTFQEMDQGINVDSGGVLNMTNMSDVNFINVKTKWWPTDIVSY